MSLERMRCVFIIILQLFAGLSLSGRAAAQGRRAVIAFTSDTQEPMWVEKLFLKQDHNLKATKMIFKDVDTLRPAALFILGDVVALGKSSISWTNIDKYIDRLRKDSIPVYATLGNHEVMFNARKGTLNFMRRFPLYQPEGYTRIVDSVAVVLLNSNFDAMSLGEAAGQNAWYRHELAVLDKNPAVKFVIVGCHHSPYTNSRIVSPSRGVQDDFVPPFLSSAKGILFLSGHSHNYEHFRVKHKDFLVIGGGGGLHQPLNANNETMHDLSADYKPMFHYIEVSRDRNALKVLSRRLKPDFSGFRDDFTFRTSPVLP